MDSYLEKARAAIEDATGQLPVERIARQIPGKWSVAQILEHLTLTFNLNASALERAIASGETKAGRTGLVNTASRVVVVDLGYFPRARAPEAVVPRGSIAPEHSREAIAEALAAVDSALARAAERFGLATPLLKHAFFGGMTVPQWRKFHFRHTVHHMRQVGERVALPSLRTRSMLRR